MLRYKPTKGIISSGQPHTSRVGKEILLAGGNAFDAAVGASLASFIAESTLTSAGGGGFCMAKTQGKKPIIYDFFSQTPRSKKLKSTEDFKAIEIDFGDAKQTFHVGMASTAVPGSFAGLNKLHTDFGKIPLREVMQPAIDLARNGLQIDDFQAFCIKLTEPIFKLDNTAVEIYKPHGNILTSGSTLKIHDYANTLEYLSKEGIQDFYKGDIAKVIADSMENMGGYITREDLEKYEVIQRKPLSLDIAGTEFYTNPPPSVGGIMAWMNLHLINQFHLKQSDYLQKPHLEALVKSMDIANKVRKEKFNAILNAENPEKQILSSIEEIMGQEKNRWGNTTHLSVVDEDGNIASITTSLGQGNGWMIPGTGIMINNMLGEEDLNPNGFHNWQENVRVPSNMSPSLLMNKESITTFGTGGANRIRSAILEFVINKLIFNKNLADTISAPRLYLDGKHIDAEHGWNPEEVVEIAERLNCTHLNWKSHNMYFGGVHAVELNKKNGFAGFGDPRRAGSIAIAD